MSGAVSLLRGFARPQLRRPRWGRLGLICLVATLALSGGYIWLRDSSLVAATEITVTGAGGDEKLVRALTEEAGSMTTLHFNAAQLAEVAEGFPAVDSIAVDASFPHAMTIRVERYVPVAQVSTASGAVGLAADGSVLRGVAIPDGTPQLPASGGLLSGEPDLAERAMLAAVAAAPRPLAKLISSVSFAESRGPVIVLSPGVELIFGDGTRAEDKWDSAAAVLADPSLTSLTYIDLSVPERPGVGGDTATDSEAQPEP